MCQIFTLSVFFLDLIFDPNHSKYKKINKIKTKLRRTHFFSGNFRMLLPTVLLGSVLIFIPHFPFGAYAKLYVDCTFERIKSWTAGQNTSASPLRFMGQLPSSKKGHNCLVKTNETDRLIYLRAKRNKWSQEGELGFSVFFIKLTISLILRVHLIKRVSFPLHIPFNSFF